MPKLISERKIKQLTRRDGRTEYIDALDTVQVQFAKIFVRVPKVFVNIDGDAHFKITNKTKTGFKIKFKDNNFDALGYTGEFDWEAVPDGAIK